MVRDPEPKKLPWWDDPESAPVGEGIENVLSNLYRVARLVPRGIAEVAPEGRAQLISGIMYSMHDILRTTPPFMERFASELAQMNMPSVAFEERRRARLLLIELKEWLQIEGIGRSRIDTPVPPDNWTISPEALKKLHELAELGRVLRATWVEVRAVHQASLGSRPPISEAAQPHTLLPRLEHLTPTQRVVIQLIRDATARREGITVTQILLIKHYPDANTIYRVIDKLRRLGLEILNPQNNVGYSFDEKTQKWAENLGEIDA